MSYKSVASGFFLWLLKLNRPLTRFSHRVRHYEHIVYFKAFRDFSQKALFLTSSLTFRGSCNARLLSWLFVSCLLANSLELFFNLFPNFITCMDMLIGYYCIPKVNKIYNYSIILQICTVCKKCDFFLSRNHWLLIFLPIYSVYCRLKSLCMFILVTKSTK